MPHIQRGWAACSYLIILTYLGRVFHPFRAAPASLSFSCYTIFFQTLQCNIFIRGTEAQIQGHSPGCPQKAAGSKLLPAVDFLIENV